MTSSGAARSALALLAVAALILGCTPRISTGSERLRIEHRGWILAGSDLDLTVEARGALSLRSVSVLVVTNGNVLGSWNTENGAARLSIASSRMRSGRNSILFKTGSERAQLEIRVVPLATPLGAVFALVFVGVVVGWRRGRSRR